MTVLHKVVLRESDGVVDLFDPTTATPPVPLASSGYIQNISNTEVQLSDTQSFNAYLIIGDKDDQPQTSTLSFESGDSVYLKAGGRKSVLTVATP